MKGGANHHRRRRYHHRNRRHHHHHHPPPHARRPLGAVPPALLEQMKPGGILLIPVGTQAAGQQARAGWRDGGMARVLVWYGVRGSCANAPSPPHPTPTPPPELGPVLLKKEIESGFSRMLRAFVNAHNLIVAAEGLASCTHAGRRPHEAN